MKSSLPSAAFLVAAALTVSRVWGAAITPGDLVIYRVGTDGNTGLNSAATAAFVDEYTQGGVRVQSIAMPTIANGSNKILTASGTASSEGMLTCSPDGAYVALTGYNAALGTSKVASSTSAAVSRTVGIISAADSSVDTSTSLTDAFDGNNIRGATTIDGTNIWVSGASSSNKTAGVRYVTKGASNSTQLSSTVTNIVGVAIYGGQLYASDSTGSSYRLSTIGSGLPETSGQTMANLPGFLTATGSPNAFFFADLSSDVAGVDTLYVADDSAGMLKYSLVGGSWVSNGTVGAGSDNYRGLTGMVDSDGTTVDLFATRKGGTGATGGGELVSLIDSSGYNGAFSGTPMLLATASANESFRGIALIVPEPASISLLALGGMALLSHIRGRASSQRI